MTILESTECRIQLLEFVIQSPIPTSGKFKRARSSPVKIKILYHLFQLYNNLKSGKWTSIYQGKTAISKCAGIGKKHFSEFINSGDFKLFGEVLHRKGTTNIYKLHTWVLEAFDFFQKKGMMKNFREDFKNWKKYFLKRLHEWVLPNLGNGLSLKDLLMNKLSPKKSLKGDGLEPLKGGGIKPSGSSIKPIGIKTNNEDAELGAKEANEVSSILANRLHLRGGDIHHFIFKNSLGLLKKAVKILCYRIEILKWVPRSNVRALQSIINDLKEAA